MRSVVVAAVITFALSAPSVAVAQPTPPPGQLVRVGNHRLHLWCRGAGSTTLLFEVGAGSWSIYYAHLQDSLAAEARVCLYDRAGLGWSESSPTPTTVTQAARSLVALVNNAKIRQPLILVAHSYGAWVVKLAAPSLRSSLAGIVLLDAAHPDQWRRLPKAKTLTVTVGEQLSQAAALAEAGRIPRASLDQAPFATLNRQWRGAYEYAMVSPKTYRAMAAEIGGSGPNAAAAAAAPGFSDLPLWIVTAGRSFDAFAGSGLDVDAGNRVWSELQADLKTWSRRAKQVVSPKSSHAIAADDPSLVVNVLRDAIRTVGRR